MRSKPVSGLRNYFDELDLPTLIEKAFSVKRDKAELGGRQINRNAQIILSLTFDKFISQYLSQIENERDREKKKLII